MPASVCSNVVCLFQPKSTTTVVIGKTANNVEEQENVAAKDEDTDEEWVEQKTDLKKLPRQYMQLSKIRLTGRFKVRLFFKILSILPRGDIENQHLREVSSNAFEMCKIFIITATLFNHLLPQISHL